MANDMEDLARSMLGNKQAAELLSRLTALAQTPEGQKLMTLISASGTAYVRKAAQAAVAGDEAGARAALAQALSTPEGAALARALAQAAAGRQNHG